MKASVQISQGIESLFGTRDENIRLIESGLGVSASLLDSFIEIQGDAANVTRAERILEDYAALVREGHIFTNGDLNSYFRVVTEDSEVSLRALVSSGRSRNFGKKVLAPKTVNQRRYLEAIERNDLVFGVGPAGTGKTYLAVAMAMSALIAKKVSRIILTRPAVEAGERLGFLPGTLQEKVDPYLRPLYDALYDMLDADKVEKYLERNTIEVAPIAFMRGRTLNDRFIILDEAQNSTPEQMKMVLTRQGFNSKMVVNGDITQIDLPSGKRSGLLDAVDVLKGVEGISFINFDERDVVRHSLVQRIVKAYERHNEVRRRPAAQSQAGRSAGRSFHRRNALFGLRSGPELRASNVPLRRSRAVPPRSQWIAPNATPRIRLHPARPRRQGPRVPLPDHRRPRAAPAQSPVPRRRLSHRRALLPRRKRACPVSWPSPLKGPRRKRASSAIRASTKFAS